jgi:hypothetical protein
MTGSAKTVTLGEQAGNPAGRSEVGAEYLPSELLEHW